MPFTPLSGPATFQAADPPRESVVVFTDERRTVALPIRAALPILTRARPTHADDDSGADGDAAAERVHPSVGLLTGAALLGLRLVAAGRFEPAADQRSWRVGPLPADDEERIRRLAASRSGASDASAEMVAAEQVVRGVLAAVVDAMPRAAPGRTGPTATGAPAVPARARESAEDFRARLDRRLARHRAESGAGADTEGLPQLVRLSLRVEADEEELAAESLRIVLQVHDEADALHVRDAADLWRHGPQVHGFGDRARVHAQLALRGAAEAWEPLERLLDAPVPDQLRLDTDELVSLLDVGVGALRERGIDVLWPRSLGRDLQAQVALSAAAPGSTVREEPLQDPLLGTGALFSFDWQLALDGDPLTPEEMDALAGAASPIIRLRGNWAVVDPALARKARRRLIRRVPASQALAAALTGVVDLRGPAAEEWDQPAPVVVGASLLRLRDRVLTARDAPPVPMPVGLHAELRGYQRQGLTWLAGLTSLGVGACLADDMGLGKTITVIALHLHRAAELAGRGVVQGPTLVVCPASLLGNWEAEIRRFAPGVEVRRFHGAAREATALSGFVLTTYGTMRRDAEALAAVPWDLVVADEAQHVKNPRSSTAIALRTIPGRARVALTGTPVENDLTELWAILDWAVPGLLGSRNAFRKRWAAPIESGTEPTVARQFAALIEPFLLRRRKSDPGIADELPPKTETDHLLSLTREQVVLYESFVRDCMERIERIDELERRGLVLAMLTGLKQICNHPAHFLKQSGAVRLAGRSQKLDLLDELVATVLPEDGALLVFTQYVAMARLLQAHLAATGVAHQFLHGGTPVKEREAMVARFQAGPEAGGPPVFLLSLKAGGTGLNLTRADHVVHLDRWWNPAVEEQATDRAYRIGQTRPVQVHRMICRGTLEERIADLLTRKRSLADAVLGRGEAALTELSNAELLDLVTLRRIPDPRDADG